MIDFVFAVDNPTDWHAANLRANPTDYSFLRVLGASGVTAVQSKSGAGIYYNTLVPSNGRLIKYGVISSQALYRDLVDWNSLYVAGRLHKPSKHLLGPLNQTLATHERLARDSALSVPQSVDSCGLVPSSVEMLHAQHWNLLSATRAALLTLPETFSFRDLCLAVSGLSYTGDFRMTFGENPNKVGNIVDANLEHFVELYATPLLVDLRDGVTLLSTRRESGLPRWQPTTQFQQDTSPTARQRLLQNVPRGLSEALAHVKQNAPRSLTRAAPEASGGLSIPNRSQILAGVAQIVAGTAISQSLKGILTGGVLKASRYALQKVGKMRSASK
ncbi:MMP37-like protein [Capsaspora owczarzaki ATCC 30864]|nr:MMP37-like protein [Capsaspora owczarzaki ATCC 30864]|eukprot:XP_004345447.1 MMP37-like protein [Capsaspora owczarzaki ATCC 30864]